MLCVNKSYTIGKPVYFPFRWCHICKEHAFLGWAAVLSKWVAAMTNVPNCLCYQAAMMRPFTVRPVCCRQHVPWNLNMWMNVVFSHRSRFCLQQMGHRVKVWRRWTVSNIISIKRYQNEIMQLLAIPEWPPLPQMLFAEWDAIPLQCVNNMRRSRAVYSCVWFFHTPLRPLLIESIYCSIYKLPICFVPSVFNYPIRQTTLNKNQWQRRFGKSFMGASHILSSAAHPKNVCSLQMIWSRFKREMLWEGN